MDVLEYKDFKNNCIVNLSHLQDDLQQVYNVNWNESWLYDQGTGLFTLSDEDKEINFRYANVGTYSRKTNTWKWSWDNDNVLENVKSEMLKVKAFGEEHNLAEIVAGYFSDEEGIGWELTAIAAKLLRAVGAYRAEDEHLLIFMVLLEVVDIDEARKIKEAFVSCEEHGSGRAAFVCQHLTKGDKTGFVEAFVTLPGMDLDEDDDLQAWCDLCEVERAKDGDWNDRTIEFADIKVICEHCYFEIKENNLQ